MKKTSFLITVILSSVAAALAPRTMAADETEFRVFDVRQLVKKVEDRAGPRFSLFHAGAVKKERPLDWDVGMEEEDEGAVMGEEELKMSILRLDPALEWDGDGIFMRIMHGRLFVKHAPEVIAQVESYLKALEDAASRTVNVKAWVFGSGPDAGEKGAVFTGPQAEEIVKQLRSGENWCEEISVTALAGQRAFATKGTQFLHLAELDPDVAQEARLHDPVMAVGDVGVVLDVRTQPSPSGKSYTATIRFFCARPLDDRGFRTIKTPGGRIQAPALRNTSLETTVVIPAGHFMLLGTSNPPEADGGVREGGGVRLLVTVEPCAKASREGK